MLILPSLVYSFREWNERFNFDEFIQDSDSNFQVLVSEAFSEPGVDDSQSITVVVIARYVAEKSHQKVAATFVMLAL
jgi:hypothetical protein